MYNWITLPYNSNEHNIVNYPCVRAKSFQSCPPLCDPMDYSTPGSSVFSKNTRVGFLTLLPGMEHVSLLSVAVVGGFFTTSATWETWLKKYNSSDLPQIFIYLFIYLKNF